MERALLVYTTYPDAETALARGEDLVRRRLAACVNVLPGMRSVYAWRGAVEHGSEVVAIVKTRAGLAERVGAAIREGHPYATPIVVHLGTEGADAATLDWILAETVDGDR